MNILEAEHLKKSFFDPKRLDVLQDISLTIPEGESIAICGKSGSGKTTLLHILGTLEEYDGGSLQIAETKVTAKNAHLLRQQKIGFIFQSFNLLEDFTTLENVLMPASIARQSIDSQSTAHQRALQLLEDVDLTTHLHTPVKMLSGGERQRVAIARALINDPKLILADEPSGNLDRLNAERIGEIIMRCVTKNNKSLLLVTHDMDLASLCHRQYILDNGMLH